MAAAWLRSLGEAGFKLPCPGQIVARGFFFFFFGLFFWVTEAIIFPYLSSFFSSHFLLFGRRAGRREENVTQKVWLQ
jgi:hypothetical protein